MSRGSKPGERRGGRQKGTPNKKTALKNALFNAAASSPSTRPLDFILGLMRDPKVPTDLRLDMAVAAAPFVHSKPQAPPRVRTNPMDSSPIKGLPNSALRTMDAELRAAGGSIRGGDVTSRSKTAASESTLSSASKSALPESTASSLSLAGSSESAATDRSSNSVVPELMPLDFLLSVMADPDATPKQRIKAARAAARYMHAAVPPDKLAAVDEYGFAISRTLAKEIGDDWLRLQLLESGELGLMTPRVVEEASQVRGRQAERDEYLQCPPGYSAERDLKRRDQLHQKWRRRELSMAEETELAFVIARITAFEAAFNRTPEGQIRRRMADLKSRRHRANRERNRRVGLTRVEGKELDELLKQYEPKSPDPLPDYWKLLEAFGDSKLLAERFQRDRELRRQQAPVGSDPNSEMEELEPSSEELREWEEEQIARRIATGDLDPWDGKAPDGRIYELEMRRVFDKELTPGEKNELQLITRLYPERVEKTRKMLARRHYRPDLLSAPA